MNYSGHGHPWTPLFMNCSGHGYPTHEHHYFWTPLFLSTIFSWLPNPRTQLFLNTSVSIHYFFAPALSIHVELAHLPRLCNGLRCGYSNDPIRTVGNAPVLYQPAKSVIGDEFFTLKNLLSRWTYIDSFVQPFLNGSSVVGHSSWCQRQQRHGKFM